MHISSICGWSPPPEGMLKMNVDASIKEGRDFSRVGVVFCDYLGIVLVACLLRVQGSFDAENGDSS